MGDNPNPTEQLATAAAAMDQMNAFGRDLASGVATYMRTLIEGGMERSEAFQLAAGYQSTILSILFVSQTAAATAAAAEASE